MLFITKYESNFVEHGFCSPSHYNRVTSKFYLHLWQDTLLWVELRIYEEVTFITILLHFHYFISLETASNEKNEVFLLKISLDIHNASGVTCQYPQIFNSSFRKEFLEILC